MNSRLKKLIVSLAVPAAAGLLFLFRNSILSLTKNMPGCLFHHLTGFLCPGCGNTRAVRALLSLDFIGALKYNVTIPILLVFAAAWYAEYIISAWIKPVKIIPRKPYFYIVLGACWCVYLIARNFV